VSGGQKNGCIVKIFNSFFLIETGFIDDTIEHLNKQNGFW
jgi:hypothetical protein